MTKPVLYDIHVRCGHNGKNAKRWAKLVTGILRPLVPNTTGLAGPFLRSETGDFEGALAEGTLILLGASKPSHDPAYMLVVVKADATLLFEDAGYRFFGTGIERVAYDMDPVDKQALLLAHPDLAPAIGKPMLAIFAALAGRFPAAGNDSVDSTDR